MQIAIVKWILAMVVIAEGRSSILRECPNGSVVFGATSCLWSPDDSASFLEANLRCRLTTPHGRLAVLASLSKHQFAVHNVLVPRGIIQAFIGLRDIYPGDSDPASHQRQFQWLSGENLTDNSFTAWDIGQPNGYGPNFDVLPVEDCVTLWPQGWSDKPCDAFYRYICEISTDDTVRNVYTVYRTGHRLQEVPLGVVRVRNAIECARSCLVQYGCMLFNFEMTSSPADPYGYLMCELLSAEAWNADALPDGRFNAYEVLQGDSDVNN